MSFWAREIQEADAAKDWKRLASYGDGLITDAVNDQDLGWGCIAMALALKHTGQTDLASAYFAIARWINNKADTGEAVTAIVILEGQGELGKKVAALAKKRLLGEEAPARPPPPPKPTPPATPARTTGGQSALLRWAASYWQQRALEIQARSRERLREVQARAESEIEGGLEAILHTLEGLDLLCSLPWEDPAWRDLRPRDAPVGPRLTRIGSLRLDLVLGKELRSDQEVPAMAPILGRGGLMLRAKGTELPPLRDLLQSVALRLLATVAPGRLRLTLIDPVGLGQHFAHLSGLDPLLRGNAALHAPKEIEEALSKITTHMSMVIQKYLMNKYDDIEAFNRSPRAVIQPYWLVLLSDFPAAFDTRMAERLLSIAKNGPRVGVHVLCTWDTSRDALHNFSDEALMATGLVIEKDRLRAPAFRDAVLLPDGPPDKETVLRLTRILNAGASQAQRVEVSFESVHEDAPWSVESIGGLLCPIGLRGTEIQQLALGSGTTHHALVGGRTGSGKSVLLHVIITGLSLRYPPKELQLYLIDFKEGVEFEIYRQLPHARVLAIESEREFGLSVLRGLADQIRERGQLFIDVGANNLGEYRERTGKPCPRILLIVDEFQTFFARGDRIAAEARALLAHLTQKGRSFGVHVLLASQSVPVGELESGTLSQLGVRIALQMSAEDSFRTLAKDNDEARYLERPGEAIYNEQDGRPSANLRFQSAFLSPQERGAILSRLTELAARDRLTDLPLVFEGNRPASLRKATELLRAVAAPPALAPRAAPLFLGEPAQLQKGHTAFRLRRQSRSHLLLCGQDEGTALRIFASACASCLAHHPPGGARLLLLDLSNTDSEVYGQLAALSALARDDGAVQIGGRRQVAPFLTQALDELKRRAAAEDQGPVLHEQARPTWLLSIFGLQGATALQRPGGAGISKATPELEALQRILLEGPDLGIHLLIWANTYGKLMSVLDPRHLPEFEGRVALRGGESERLLGQGAAGLVIRPHYGLLWRQEEGDELERFRCYGDIVQWLKEQETSDGTGTRRS